MFSVFTVTPSKIKNQNHSVEKVQNLMKADNIQYTFMWSYVSTLSFFKEVDGALLLSVQFRCYNTQVKSPVIKLFRSCPKIFDDNEKSVLSNKLHFFNCRIVLNCETWTAQRSVVTLSSQLRVVEWMMGLFSTYRFHTVHFMALLPWRFSFW